MLNLTMLDPTIQQTLHQYSLEILTRQIQTKFAPPLKTTQTISHDLAQLSLTDLTNLLVEMLTFKTLEQFNHWLESSSTPPADPIEPFIGLIQSDHSDWLDHHDDYLGQTLHAEMAKVE